MAVISIFESYGANGNSDINQPILVKSPSSSNAPKLYKVSSADIKLCSFGLSIKSKLSKSFIPIAFNIKTVSAKLVL